MNFELKDTDIPVVLRGVRPHFDKIRNIWLLLAPERVLKLDDTGRAILDEIDGERNFSDITRILAQKYNAPVERIAGDVRTYVSGLVARRMVDVR